MGDSSEVVRGFSSVFFNRALQHVDEECAKVHDDGGKAYNHVIIRFWQDVELHSCSVSIIDSVDECNCK